MKHVSKREQAYIDYEKQFTDEELQIMSDERNKISKPLLIVGLSTIGIATTIAACMTVLAPMGWWIF